MLSPARKLIAFFFAILFLLPITYYLLPSPAHAQLQTVAPSPANPLTQLLQTDTNTPLTIVTLTQEIVLGLLSTANCAVSGIGTATPNNQCLSYDQQTHTFGYTQHTTGGLLGLVGSGITLAFNQPFSTSDYLSYLSHSWIVHKAEAASNGVGFDQLAPITNLWLAFRNLAYLLFVIVFIVIGFAIMLRAKIDPRTVMTIENQIPKLIVALLLITFSFAIAGFVLDIMWITIYLAVNIFTSLDPALAGQVGAITKNITTDPFGFVNSLNGSGLGWFGIVTQAAGGVKNTISSVLLTLLNDPSQAIWVKAVFFPFTIVGYVGCLLNVINPFGGHFFDIGNVNNCADHVIETFVSGIIGALVLLIFAIAFLVVLIRVWWTLIKSYSLYVIFSIFGPVVIMSGVLPGSKTNFEYWIRHLLAYAIVFPTAMGIFLLGKTLMDVYSAAHATPPPFFGTAGSGSFAFLGPIMGFAVMMMAPQALTMVQDTFNAQDPKYLAGIGQALGVGSQAAAGGLSKFGERAFRAADPIHNLDEGWARRIVLNRNNRVGRFFRSIVMGRESGLGKLSETNKFGGGPH